MLSVVVPVRDEADNVEALTDEIDQALAGSDYEVIFVDDGSVDATRSILARLTETGPHVRWIAHPRPLGQSAKRLSGATMVVGFRHRRNDPWPKRLGWIEHARPGASAIESSAERDGRPLDQPVRSSVS